MDNDSNEPAVLAEAEAIFKAEERKIRAEICPEGEDCPVHFRVDGNFFSKEDGYARLISYVGEYVVFTEDNPQASNPALLIKAVLGRFTRDDLPPRWATMIVHVGDGVIGDAEGQEIEERRKAFRYLAEHDNWDEIVAQHMTTVALFKAGLIDVSKPYKMED